MTPLRPRSVVLLCSAALLALEVAGIAAYKLGLRAAPGPRALAVTAGLLAISLLAAAIEASVRTARGPRRLSAVAEAIAAAGMLAVVAGGLANWTRGLQGFVLLSEREPVRLLRTEDLADFEAGPLADRRELDVTIALARLELVPAAGGAGFAARSRVRVLDATGIEAGMEIAPGRAARHGTLVFRQGAFGFSPHIVVAGARGTVLDAFVPFRTIREGPDGIAFLGDLEVSAERLRIRAAVTLADLNDDMKGHPQLELSVEHDGRAIGSGTLSPGEFADLKEGYRIGFAGLRRWAEIDFSRRTYPIPILAGLAAFLLGLGTAVVARWRGR